MQRAKLFLFVGLSLVGGFIWGLAFSPAMPQCHLGRKMPGQMATVDVIRNGDDIWIVEHKTEYLIFEYNRLKETDKDAFGDYEGLLIETLK